MQNIRQKIEEIMKDFKCIQSGCDNNGIIAVADENGDPEAEQCQYCYEIRFPLKEKITQSHTTLLQDIYNEVGEMKKPAGTIDKTFYYNQALQDTQTYIKSLMDNK